MKHYVVGFVFDEKMERVVLITKNRPAWQAGLLNGVGGHIEVGETPFVAMAREFEEETGVSTPLPWNYVLTLRFPYAILEVFTAKSDYACSEVRSVTDEQVVIATLDALPQVVENLPPIIELCRQRLTDREGVAPVSWSSALREEQAKTPPKPAAPPAERG